MLLMLILKAFYFCWPAYLANMMPVIFDRLGILKPLRKPIDGGRRLGVDSIFGENKTWRGIIAGVIGGLIAALIQYCLFTGNILSNLAIIDYSGFIVLGLLGGLGAILGDLAKSFLKRRFSIKSGRSWPVFDQIDYIVGFFIFTYWFTRPSWEIIVTAIILSLVLHPIVNMVAYSLKIKKVWW